jgi:hypothetical protein
VRRYRHKKMTGEDQSLAAVVPLAPAKTGRKSPRSEPAWPGPTVSGGTPQPADVGTRGTMLSGTSPDGAKAIEILMFSEGKAAVTIEFDGAANDPVPQDGALDIAKKQDAAISRPDCPSERTVTPATL